MNKLTKLLSVFVIAGAIGTGVAGVAGCKKSNPHKHSYTYTVDVEDATKHNGVCDCGKDPIVKEGHVDTKDNDGNCDLCGAPVQQQSTEVTVTGVTVTAAGGATSVAAEGTLQLSAAVAGTGNPAQTVTWSTSDDSKATVSTTGLVTGVAEGTVTITATSTVDTTKKGTINLTVTEKGTTPPPVEKTIYETLKAQSNKLYNNEFGEAETVGVHGGYGNKGIYTDIEGAAKIADGVLKHQEGVKNDKDEGINSSIIIDFGPVASGGVLEGYMELSCNAMGSKWNLVRFYNKNTPVFTLRVPSTWTSKSGGNFVYSLDGGTTEVDAEEAVEAKADTVYKLYYKFDLETGKVTVTVNDKKIVTDLQTEINGVSGINIASSSSGSRLVTIDNVVFCGTQLTVAEYRPTVLANLETEYAKYVLEGADATHSTNKALVTAAYNKGVEDITAAPDIDGVSGAYATAVAAMKDVLSDAQIPTAITAAKTSLRVKFPADNYSIDFAAGDDDAIYNNKTAYETAIGLIEEQIDNGATTKSALDKIVADAVISVENNATKLAAKKAAVTGAEGIIATYKATETAEIETTHATQYAAIAAARAAAVTGVNADTTDTIAKVNAIITELKGNIDGALLETQETLEQAIARYQGLLEADGTTAKGTETDATKLAAVDTAVTAGKAAIAEVTNKDEVGNIYKSEKAKVLVVIPRINAKADLLTSKTEALEEIHGTNEEENTAITAVNTAYSEGVEAIDAAADADAVTEKLETAQGKIEAAITKLKNTKYAITVKKSDGTTISSSDLKIAYGQKLEIDESKLTIADNEKLDKYYNTCTGGVLSDEITTEVKVYGEVTVYVSIIEAKRIVRDDSFNYSKIVKANIPKIKDKNGNDTTDNAPIPQSLFNGTQNEFMTILGEGVTYRDSQGDCIELKGEAMQVTIENGGTLTIQVASTGGSNWSSIAVKDASGEYMPATYTASDKIANEGNAYGVYTTTKATFTFKLPAGTYTLCTLASVDGNSTNRSTRLYALTIHEDNKVDLDVTVNWGSVTKKYYHTDKITAPVPTGLADNEEFKYWYHDVDDEAHKWVDGSTLAAGTYTFTAKKETVTAVDSVTLTASAEEIQIGGSGVTLTAVAKDADENVLDRTPVWSLGDYEYAEVVDGVLTLKDGAKANDKITVTATVGSKSDSVEITVKAPAKGEGWMLDFAKTDAQGQEADATYTNGTYIGVKPASNSSKTAGTTLASGLVATSGTIAYQSAGQLKMKNGVLTLTLTKAATFKFKYNTNNSGRTITVAKTSTDGGFVVDSDTTKTVIACDASEHSVVCQAGTYTFTASNNDVLIDWIELIYG